MSSTCLNRFMQIKQRWNDFGEFSTLEKIERSKDIDELLSSLENKIQVHEIFEKSKSSVINEELNRINEQIEIMRAQAKIAQQKEKNVIENSKKQAESRCINLQEDMQIFTKKLDNVSKNEANSVLLQVQEENKNCISQLNNQKKQILEIKQFIEKSLKQAHIRQKQSLNGLCQNVDREIGEIHDYISQRRLQRMKKEEKLNYMTENLMSELAKIIQKEQNQGKIAYDCLLKLIEDFHSHIKNNSIM